MRPSCVINEKFGGEWLASSTVRTTLLTKVHIWTLLEWPMIVANYRDLGRVIYILDLRIVIAITVDRFGPFDKTLGCCMRPASTSGTTVLLGKMIGRSLLEWPMLTANDSDFGLAIYVLDLCIIEAITVDCFGPFNERFGGEAG